MTTRLLALAVGLLLCPLAGQAQPIVEYYHLDGVGNVIAVTGAAGAVVEQHDYLPFGEEWCETSVCGAVTAGQSKRFTGKERDAETGLDYFGARYYASKIGRFTTADPFYNWNENLVDPQRWNRYAYGRNNPLRYVDPDGKDVIIKTPQLPAQALQRNSEIQAAVMGFINKWDPFPADPIAAGMVLGLIFPTSQKEYNTNLALSAFDMVAPLEMAGATEIVQRAMSRAEVEATQATGLIRGGRAGTHYVSDAVNASALRARERLALGQTPEVRATLEVPAGRFTAPSKVAPKGGMPGGGTERAATGAVPAKVLRVDELKR